MRRYHLLKCLFHVDLVWSRVFLHGDYLDPKENKLEKEIRTDLRKSY